MISAQVVDSWGLGHQHEADLSDLQGLRASTQEQDAEAPGEGEASRDTHALGPQSASLAECLLTQGSSFAHRREGEMNIYVPLGS